MTQVNSTPLVTACLSTIEAELAAAKLIPGKVHIAYSEAEMFTMLIGKTLPVVGIIYEGIVASEHNTASKSTSVSSQLIASVCIVTDTDTAIGVDKAKALKLVDDIRDTIKGLRNPQGHLWIFKVEGPAAVKNNKVLWVQRWATAVQL